VPDGPAGAPRFDAETLASARSRIVSAVAYSRSGRVPQADLRIAGNAVTESYVDAVLDPEKLLDGLDEVNPAYAREVERRAREVDTDERRGIAAERAALQEAGRPVETYRRIELDEALGRLLP
jgi:hypothetical protein